MDIIRPWLGTFLAILALIEFLFWGGNSVGLTIFFLLLLIAYYAGVGLKKLQKGYYWHFIFLGTIILLAVTYSLFDNLPLRVINFMALLFLCGLLFLQPTWGDGRQWDRFRFQLEQFLGYVIRPFIALAQPWVESRKRFSKNRSTEKKTNKRILFQILLGICIALPLIGILALLLASSDRIFADLLGGIFQNIFTINFSTLVVKMILALLLLPFVASVIWSYKNSWLFMSPEQRSSSSSYKKIPTALAATILVLINFLYLCYGVIQFVYLLGGKLPEGISYADYARRGFFELAFIALINFGLLLVCLYAINRQGRGNIIIRILSLLLVILSSVQLMSAFIRMNLYVNAYGLSRLRFFVLAFMTLLGGWFIIFIIKEWKKNFPLFKSLVISAFTALLIVNYCIPDRLIAKYNIDNYLFGHTEELDMSYIAYNLSLDAEPVIWESKKSLIAKDSKWREEFKNIEEIREEKLMYASSTNWKDINLSIVRAQSVQNGAENN